MKTSLKFLVVPLAIGALLAGCGSSDSSSNDTSSTSDATQSKPADNSSGGAETLALAADPSGALAYEPDKLDAKAGEVKVDFTNDSPVPHDVVFEDSAGKEVAKTPVITGESSTTEFDAKPGDYTFFCSVPGHEAGGMKGTLTVK